MRLALGIAYRGTVYHGWQVQRGVPTVQGELERALSAFADRPIHTSCAGRTDAGVHALNQVVHLDTDLERQPFSWVRGTNRFLPPDIAVQWCRPMGDSFHARYSALGRRYRYLLRESPVRPALEAGACGWTFRTLDGDAMREAAARLIGTHDFSAFRSSECQARSPVKTLKALEVRRHGAYWRFDFDASAFLHHMVRNLMGCVLEVGAGSRPVHWIDEVLASRRREAAAPTFSADGLYFEGPYYDAALALPESSPADDWIP